MNEKQLSERVEYLEGILTNYVRYGGDGPVYMAEDYEQIFGGMLSDGKAELKDHPSYNWKLAREITPLSYRIAKAEWAESRKKHEEEMAKRQFDLDWEEAEKVQEGLI